MLKENNTAAERKHTARIPGGFALFSAPQGREVAARASPAGRFVRKSCMKAFAFTNLTIQTNCEGLWWKCEKSVKGYHKIVTGFRGWLSGTPSASPLQSGPVQRLPLQSQRSGRSRTPPLTDAYEPGAFHGHGDERTGQGLAGLVGGGQEGQNIAG